MDTTINYLKLMNRLEKLVNLEPDETFWQKFAEEQIKKMSNISPAEKAFRASQYKVHIKH